MQLTVNSPAGGALLVCISIEADPDPSVLSATTINLYLAPGSNPIDNQFEQLLAIKMKVNIKTSSKTEFVHLLPLKSFLRFGLIFRVDFLRLIAFPKHFLFTPSCVISNV